MPPQSYTFKPPNNPILQVLYFLVGGVLLIGAFFMGAIILAVVLGFAVILGIIIYIRIWWLNRKIARSGRKSADEPSQSGESTVIEVEYTVVDERDERDK